MTPAMIHVMVGFPLLVVACLLQLMPDSLYAPYSLRYFSQDTRRWAPLATREGIRFILLLVGATQIWAGIRDW
jgi:hypothetical protein